MKLKRPTDAPELSAAYDDPVSRAGSEARDF